MVEAFAGLTRCAAVLVVFLIGWAVHLRVQRDRYADGLARTSTEMERLHRSVFHASVILPSPAMHFTSERIRLERLATDANCYLR